VRARIGYSLSVAKQHSVNLSGTVAMSGKLSGLVATFPSLAKQAGLDFHGVYTESEEGSFVQGDDAPVSGKDVDDLVAGLSKSSA
jgi:hypothetical protein